MVLLSKYENEYGVRGCYVQTFIMYHGTLLLPPPPKSFCACVDNIYENRDDDIIGSLNFSMNYKIIIVNLNMSIYMYSILHVIIFVYTIYIYN